MSPELKAYNRDGYVVAKNLVSQASIDTVNRSLLRVVQAQLCQLGRNEDSRDLFSALRTLFSKDLDRYKKVVGALWRHESVFALMHSAPIVDFLRQKFGWTDLFLPGGQVILIMAKELKIPDGYFGFIPHQDFPSVQGSLDGVVVWLPLTNVDRTNYPMEIIPGSHRKGTLRTINHGSSTWEVDPDEYRAEEFMPVEVNMGDVVFMSLFTIHRSSLEGLPGKLRVAISTRFDNGGEASFIERAYPTAYIRSVHREQYLPGFPTQTQIDRVFGR
jgi:ectoine hydroxylase-related dioxygenase (phytanoyl-CoA dioxygenase family)